MMFQDFLVETFSLLDVRSDIKQRFQGSAAAGHQDLVRRVVEDGSERFTHNYLNFSVENFNCEEMGSLETIVQRQREQHTLEDRHPEDNDDELI